MTIHHHRLHHRLSLSSLIIISYPPQVIRTAQCRKCGVISHVRIHILFDSEELNTASVSIGSTTTTTTTSTSYSDRMTMLRYPTARVKSIRRALQASGHIIVGDGGAIKSNKGRTKAITIAYIINDICAWCYSLFLIISCFFLSFT